MTDAWEEDLSPIGASDWTPERALHLLNRAGFGGSPDEVQRLAAMPPEKAVAWFIDFKAVDNSHLPPFDHSGIYDPTLTPFPPTRPAATRLAQETGSAMGVDAKPAGPRRLQPVADRFFYWVRASMLETRRVANWWADRMVATNRPLQEKLALFWHGHFASSEDKVRDYRKMLGQVALFQEHAAGNFGALLAAVARDPGMLVFLDAGQNLKSRPNENFGRELMELFTMGVGNYTEQDLREAARAFTGWRDNDLSFHIDEAQHDDGQKTLLGHTGPLGGQDVLDIILAQPATANFIAGKLYRFLVRDDLSPAFQEKLGGLLRSNAYEIAPFLETVFLSRDFYSPSSVGTHIKGPVELIVSTYRRLGFERHARHARFQQRERRPRAGAALPADCRWLESGARLDHARLASCARQFRPRRAPAGCDRFHRPEPRPLSRAAPSFQRAYPSGRRHRHRLENRGRGGQQTSSARRYVGAEAAIGYGDAEFAQRARGVQHPLCEPERLGRGGAPGEADATRRRPVQPDHNRARERRALERGRGRSARRALSVGPARSRGPVRRGRLP